MILIFNKIDAYTYVKKERDDLTPITRKLFTRRLKRFLDV